MNLISVSLARVRGRGGLVLERLRVAVGSVVAFVLLGVVYLVVFGFPVLAVCAWVYHLVLPLFGVHDAFPVPADQGY